MFKRFGCLSVGALLALSLISHIPVAKAEMSTGKFIHLIEAEGKVSNEVTKEFLMKGFLASTYVGLRWANLMLKIQRGSFFFASLPVSLKQPMTIINYLKTS